MAAQRPPHARGAGHHQVVAGHVARELASPTRVARRSNMRPRRPRSQVIPRLLLALLQLCQTATSTSPCPEHQDAGHDELEKQREGKLCGTLAEGGEEPSDGPELHSPARERQPMWAQGSRRNSGEALRRKRSSLLTLSCATRALRCRAELIWAVALLLRRYSCQGSLPGVGIGSSSHQSKSSVPEDSARPHLCTNTWADSVWPSRL